MARSIKVDTSELEKLGKDLTVGQILTLGRLAERGYHHLAGQAVWGKSTGEVPFKTGNLRQGVAPPGVVTRSSKGTKRTVSENREGYTELDLDNLRAELTVSARSARKGSRSATVHYPSGKRKQITLRPTQAFNYAEVVHEGRPAIFPKLGKAILIPVLGAPSNEPYITEGDNIYVVRKSAKAVAPNRFMDRTAIKLEAEAPAVAGAVFGELFA